LPKDIFPPSFFLVGQTEEKMKVDTPDVKSGGRKVRQINNKNKDPESKKKVRRVWSSKLREFAKIQQTIVFLERVFESPDSADISRLRNRRPRYSTELFFKTPSVENSNTMCIRRKRLVNYNQTYSFVCD
jgi:hypothetical protein